VLDHVDSRVGLLLDQHAPAAQLRLAHALERVRDRSLGSAVAGEKRVAGGWLFMDGT